MATPVPIPNTAVKHLSADNTWLDTARESKSLPDLYQAFCANSTKACFIFSAPSMGAGISTTNLDLRHNSLGSFCVKINFD